MIGLFVVIGVLIAMAVGPVQSLTAASERVDGLTTTRDQLSAQVDLLDERRQRLEDPEELELLAREQFGLVRPGEIPYVVVTPEPEFSPADEVGPDPTSAVDALPWYRRLWDAFARLFEDQP